MSWRVDDPALDYRTDAQIDSKPAPSPLLDQIVARCMSDADSRTDSAPDSQAARARLIERMKNAHKATPRVSQ